MESNTIPFQRKYFPNLDGLRFIGALIIIILHTEDIKAKHSREIIPWVRYFNPTGEMVVSLFFVLSGFLITYLLLKERKDTGNINLKAYYLRRTLRIWPLYYLIIILGYFVFPYFDVSFNSSNSARISDHFWLYFAGCALFLSPFVRASKGLPQTIGQIWSVGVEEAFYLCWPLFLKKTGNYIKLFLFIIIGIILIRNTFLLSEPLFQGSASGKEAFAFGKFIVIQYRITCMAIGGIGAYLLAYEKKILYFIFRKDVQYVIYSLTIGLLIAKAGLKSISAEKFPSFNYEWYSILFCIIITNLAANPKSVIRLDYSWMNYLGKVSYGLYMYSPGMRILALISVEKIFSKEISGWQMNIVYYLFTLFSTIVVAIISYEVFEKKFMLLGKRNRKLQAV